MSDSIKNDKPEDVKEVDPPEETPVLPDGTRRLPAMRFTIRTYGARSHGGFNVRRDKVE